MLIEQIFEFESRVPGPLIVHIFLKLVIFMTKQKSDKNFMTKQKMSASFNAKNVAESNILIFLTWAKSQNLISKC